jgi:ATP-dependent Lhr-like helicase
VEILRGRLEGTGPTTAASLAGQLGLEAATVETALVALESEGFVLRGEFTPSSREADPAKVAETGGRSARRREWCARRLLARIHRYTINRLRREIEPVEPADFIRFLLVWQKAAPGSRETGPESLAGVIDQLEGFEAPAAAWEGEILPARLEEYDPVWLDTLCQSGRVLWARLSPPRSALTASGEAERPRPAGPIRTTPVALLGRAHLPVWKSPRAVTVLSSVAGAVHEALSERGATFFDDLVQATGLLRTQVEEGLGELVRAGLVTSDSFTGLRALLTPSSRRRPVTAGRRRRSTALFGMESAGRWALLPRDGAREARTDQGQEGGLSGGRQGVETIARALLRRYGVIFRKLLDREGLLPPWRELLRFYRLLEARGEVRGGRFVSGFSGEQFALPDAVGALRSIRRSPAGETLVSVSAADPLNLVGVLTPGGRIPPVPANRILYRDGTPIAIREAGRTRFLAGLDPQAEWQANNALLLRRVPPQRRAYLGRPA